MRPITEFYRTVTELELALEQLRGAGKTVALVPTMGALHEGHLALVDAADRLADVVVVSIFVNPTQFGAGEDFDKYPRSLERDADLLEEFEPLIFAPTAAEMYPSGNTVKQLKAGPMGEIWEGSARPGHFDGVLTVVNRFFEIVKPDLALFGEKDWQQLTLIRRMANEFHPKLKVVEVQTVRDENGFAFSSRNANLTSEQLAKSSAIPLSLRLVVNSGGTPGSLVHAREMLERAGVKIDYLAIVDENLEPKTEQGPARVIFAGWLGSVRLIDNLPMVIIGER
jgi:pantoate--beta-alanine ligase